MKDRDDGVTSHWDDAVGGRDHHDVVRREESPSGAGEREEVVGEPASDHGVMS